MSSLIAIDPDSLRDTGSFLMNVSNEMGTIASGLKTVTMGGGNLAEITTLNEAATNVATTLSKTSEDYSLALAVTGASAIMAAVLYLNTDGAIAEAFTTPSAGPAGPTGDERVDAPVDGSSPSPADGPAPPTSQARMIQEMLDPTNRFSGPGPEGPIAIQNFRVP